MLEGFKPLLNKVLHPCAALFAALRIHPNVLTVTGVLFFGAATVLIAEGSWKIALILVITGSIIDGLDGVVARDYGKKSSFGAVLDSTCDRITELMWFGGILAFYINNPLFSRARGNIYLALIALGGSFMISYVKARSEGAGISCRAGILQRPERLILLCVFLFAGPDFMVWGLGFLAIMTWITVLQRIWRVFDEGRKLDSGQG
ncbi:MAG: CDP-alcohol phosphatidyltransferase family protein [Chitinivibrionales bacterium]|nr:CDP-alcohol phosphatidyltransferase family protein [Chitinivibrionales bacterium]